MFNPFYPFQPRLFEPLIKKGVRYFVLQSYQRGEGFMLSHYTSPGLAQQHFGSLEHDPERRYLEWENPEDQSFLKNFVASHQVFAYLKIPNAEVLAKKHLDKRLMAYINHKTSWKPRRNDEVSFDLDFIFGEVYVVLRYAGQRQKVKMEELEKMHYVL